MTIRLETPCDHGPCPYEAEYWRDCEYWCGSEEPEDDPSEYEDPPVYLYDGYPDD